MARYRITTPATGHTGAVGKVNFVNGVAEADEDAHAAELAYFRTNGFVVEELDAKGEPVAEPPAARAATPAKKGASS